MKMLFIGGTLDGKYMDVPVKKYTWKVIHLTSVPASKYAKGSEVPFIAPVRTVDRYRKVDISLCEMMVIDYLSVGEVIPRLMGGYRPDMTTI